MTEPTHVLGTLKEIGGYRIDLLLGRQASVDADALRATLQQLDPNTRVEGLVVTFEQEPRSSLAFGASDEAYDVREALAQTWDWPGAGHALSHAVSRLTVREEPGEIIRDRFERLRRFNVVVRAALEHLPAVALHWIPSQRLVDPVTFVESLAHGGSVTDHAVNVRLFRIPDGRPGETIMDTLGLTPFGVPDLQVHFFELDPMELAPVLLHYVEYLFEKGDVLAEEDLVRGIESYDEWGCAREDSLAPPARPVVDLRPGDHGVNHRT